MGIFSKFLNSIGITNLFEQTSVDRQQSVSNRVRLYDVAWYIFHAEFDKTQFLQTTGSLQDTMSYVNFAKDLMSRIVDYTTNKDFSLFIDRKSETLSIEELGKLQKISLEELLTEHTEEDALKEYIIKTKYLLPLIHKFWENNKERGITYRGLVESLQVEGDLFIYLRYNETTKQVDMIPYTGKFVRITPKRDNIKAIESVLLEYEYYIGEESHTYKMYLDDTVKKIYDSSLGNPDTEWHEEEPHYLGIVPFVHATINSSIHKTYGYSSLLQLLGLSNMSNSKLNDISEIIDYHASPITIVKGAKLSNLKKAPNKIWSNLPKDADVFNLNMQTDLRASMEFVNIMDSLMARTGKYPIKLLNGDTGAISNTSGVALQTLYKPIEDGITDLKDSVTKLIDEMSTINLRILEYNEEVILKNFKRGYKVTTKVNTSLPKDDLYQLQTIAQKLLMEVMSKQEAMRELGNKNPSATAREIREEKEEAYQFNLDHPENTFTDTPTDTENKVKATIKNVGGLGSPKEQDNAEKGRDK